MQYKEDWEKSKERFNAFWEGEIVDRCCIAVTAPRNKPVDSTAALMEARDLVEKWTSNEYRMSQFIHNCSVTYFGGEAFPAFAHNLGLFSVASLKGSSYSLGENTVWYGMNPIIKEWSNAPEIALDESSEMWNIVLRMTEYFCKKAEGRYFVAISGIGGSLDIAAAIRTTEKFLCDLYDNPFEVKSLIGKIDLIWFDIYNKLYSLINRYIEGVTTWMRLWSRDRWYPLQCDFSAMISPQMFEEFAKPSIAKQAAFLDKSIYHMDGPGQIPHLDHILDIDGLKGIQWSPGAGNSDAGDEKWFPMYKKIQAKDKNLVLLGLNPDKIEKLLENISSKGLFISTSCSTEDEAKDILNKVAKWTK